MLDSKILNAQMLRTLLTILQDGKKVKSTIAFKGDINFNSALAEIKQYDTTNSWKDFYRIAKIEYHKYKFTIGSSPYFYGRNLVIIKSTKNDENYVLNIDVRDESDLFDITHDICDALDKFGVLRGVPISEDSVEQMMSSFNDSNYINNLYNEVGPITRSHNDDINLDINLDLDDRGVMNEKIDILMKNMKYLNVDEIEDLTNLGNLARMLFFEYKYNTENIKLYNPRLTSEEDFYKDHQLMALISHLHDIIENVKSYYLNKETKLSIAEYVKVYRKELEILKMVYDVNLNLQVYYSDLFIGVFVEDYNLLVYENDLNEVATLDGSSPEFMCSFVMNSEEITPFLEELTANAEFFGIFTKIIVTKETLSILTDSEPLMLTDEEVDEILRRLKSDGYLDDDDF